MIAITKVYKKMFVILILDVCTKFCYFVVLFFSESY